MHPWMQTKLCVPIPVAEDTTRRLSISDELEPWRLLHFGVFVMRSHISCSSLHFALVLSWIFYSSITHTNIYAYIGITQDNLIFLWTFSNYLHIQSQKININTSFVTGSARQSSLKVVYMRLMHIFQSIIHLRLATD